MFSPLLVLNSQKREACISLIGSEPPKLSAVFSTNAVEYSRFMAEDEVATQNQITFGV